MSSIWWRKREQPIRLAVFVSFNALAQIVGALLLYGCGSISGAAIEGWRLSYIICAILTLVGGALFFIFVPKSRRRRGTSSLTSARWPCCASHRSELYVEPCSSRSWVAPLVLRCVADEAVLRTVG